MISTKPLIASVLAVVLLVPRGAGAQVPTAGSDTSGDKKAEARKHFELALSHFDREEWEAALVEFNEARRILPTKGNTKNTAVCLRKLRRFGDALELFETLVRDFGAELSAAERAAADKEIAELRASVGTVEILDAPGGALVTVDGASPLTAPLKAPLRLSIGTHSIRVVKDGFLPFETSVVLVGRQAAVVHAQLAALTQAGRLKVIESSGKAMDIVLDGAVVGRTPTWEGALSPGSHTLLLRGEGLLGTPPTSIVVKVNEAATLELTGEELLASLKVNPTPASALVAIDGVNLPRGPWEGRLRPGDHKVEVRLEGFGPESRDITLGEGSNRTVDVNLESAAPKGRAGLQFEIDGAVALGLLWGGDLATSCTGSCSAGSPTGFNGLFHGSYRFPSGWGIGIHAGYLTLGRTLEGRSGTLLPKGRPTTSAAIDDRLLLSGLLVGPEGQFDTGSEWPFTFRLGGGVLLAKVKDARESSGGSSFVDSKGAGFTVSTSQSPRTTLVYVAPEVRFGHRFGETFEINVGVELLVAGALSTVKWDDSKTVPAGGDGVATFQPVGQTFTGGILLVTLPGIGAKLQF